MSPDSSIENMVRLGEAARQAGLTTQQLQYYLMVGLVEPTQQSSGGQRLFDRRAVKRIRMIRLLNESGYALRDIREIFLTNQSSPGTRSRPQKARSDAKPESRRRKRK